MAVVRHFPENVRQLGGHVPEQKQLQNRDAKKYRAWMLGVALIGSFLAALLSVGAFWYIRMLEREVSISDVHARVPQTVRV